MTTPFLISAETALEHLGEPETVFLDGSWTFAGGPEVKADGFIPKARPFDIDTVKDPASPLPHMLPTPEVFTGHGRALGLNASSRIIVYDRFGLFSAARVWWMLRTMGHDAVAVLDGGLPAWIAAGGPVEEHAARDWPPGDFESGFRPDGVVDLDRLSDRIRTGSAQILDARGAARFDARVAEPREGMRSGHMPGARNLPFTRLLDHDGHLDIRAEFFQDAGIDLDKPIITTCGSGVTACILSLALACLGRDSAVYDGSWSEWGGRPDTDIETGPVRS